MGNARELLDGRGTRNTLRDNGIEVMPGAIRENKPLRQVEVIAPPLVLQVGELPRAQYGEL